MTSDRFPYDELREMGFEPVPMKPPAPSIKAEPVPRGAMPEINSTPPLRIIEDSPDRLVLGYAAPIASIDPTMRALSNASISAPEAARAVDEALDCLAEIVFGDGLRLATHHCAVAALAVLGITKRPEKRDG